MEDKNKKTVKRESRSIMLGLVGIIIAAVALAVIGFYFLKEPPVIIEGQADAASVTISGKLPGRVEKIYVKEGDMVKKGDTLVHIHSSVAEAQLMRAQATETAAAAQNKKVDAGARPQMIQGAQDLVDQAEAAVEITKKTYERMEALYNEDVVPAQKRDEALAAYKSAIAARDAAQSQLSLAKAGAQQEDKTSSAAMVTVAKGGVREVQSVLEDQYLLAPCDGQIDQIYPEVGELVALGAPIMNLLKIDDKYITFNVREEYLADLPLGSQITVMIPALDKMETTATIYYERDMGTYATWRATKTTGQWDSRTFCIKARPDGDIPQLRPGMTVILKYDKAEKADDDQQALADESSSDTAEN